MLLNLNEQKALAEKRKNKKVFFGSMLVNFLLIFIALIAISSNKITADNSLISESGKVYEENRTLKMFIDIKLKEYKIKSDSVFNLGLNLSTNNSIYYANIDTLDIDDLIDMANDNTTILDSISYELNLKWDSVYNVPVFMPIVSTDLDRISDYYGWRKHPIKKRWIFHTGIDIVARNKAEILATSNGVVVKKIKSRRGYGNRIVLDHKNGFKTLYAHLNTFNVNIGDTVKRGDIIGYMGSTGLSTGTHLHYEVLKNNKHQNPLDYMYELAKK